MTTQWRNWAGDQRCAPAEVARPTSRDQLAEAVARAAAAGLQVRVGGSGHSFTDIACTDGLMLRLEGMSRVLDSDRDSGLVKVEPGIVLGDLTEKLDELGLAFENLGDIDRQTLAGSISTATHGTGARFQNISAQVAGLELVTGDGEVVELSRGSDREALLAARVGLGALGAISAVTLHCVPSYTLRRVDSPKPLAETLERIDELADSNDHFEFYVFPHTDVALCRETERTDEAPRPRDPRKEYLQEVVLENRLVELAARTGRRFPSLIPAVNRRLAAAVGRSVKVDRSHRVFASQRHIRFTEMEYGIPREHGAEAVRRVLELVPRRGIEVNFPIEVRFVAADDAYLSPSHDQDTCYIAVHMFRGMEWYPYFRGVEAIMNDYGGRPHWGKRHFQSAETLAPRYPKWDAFRKVRAGLDPRGVFGNEYTDRVLGPAATS